MTARLERRAAPINHAPLLDLLRASAAVLVLFGHTRNWIFTSIAAVDHPSAPLKFFWLISVLEHEAVVVFFVISGFLVGGGGIARSIRDGSFDLAKYLIARFSRIYIVYVPALIVTGAAFWIGNTLLNDFGGDTIRPLFSEWQPNFGGVRAALCHVACVQGFICEAWKQNPALWSLGYEWVLYLFAPAILWCVLTQGVSSVRLAAIFLVLCGAAAMSSDLKEWAFWFVTWFVGVAAWHVSQTRGIPLAAGLCGLGSAAAAMAISRLQIVDLVVTDLVIAGGTSLAIACRPLSSFPLLPRFSGSAAAFSYSLYAIHQPIVFLTISILQNLGFPKDKLAPGVLAFFEFGVCVAVSIALSYVFSICTERQTEKMRRWLEAALSRGGPFAFVAPVSIKSSQRLNISHSTYAAKGEPEFR